MKKAAIVLVLFLLGSIYVPAQETVRITKRTSGKASIDVSGMAVQGVAAREFISILQRDLLLSGWFDMAGQGQGEFRLVGSAEQGAGQLSVKCQAFRTGDSASIFSKGYTVNAAETAKLAHTVADGLIESITGNPGYSNTKIAMIGTASNAKELYICDADGSNLRQLTRDRTPCMNPNWSPDGQKLYYTAYLKRYPDLYAIDLHTGRRTRVSKYTNLNTGGAVSPDGRSLALILTGRDPQQPNPVISNPELCVKELNTGRVTELTKTPRAAEASPSWSPDGREIVYVSDEPGTPQLYIISRSGGRPRRLTSRGSQNVSPDWGPRGIVFATRMGGRFIVAVINPVTHEITYPEQDDADYEDPRWAPDGRHIIATRTKNHVSRLYILDTMGDSPIALMPNLKEGDWYSPAWSYK